jgi:hypothetical protein
MKFIQPAMLILVGALATHCASNQKEPDGPAENAGEKVDEAAEDTKQAADDAGEKIEEKADEAKEKVDDDSR